MTTSFETDLPWFLPPNPKPDGLYTLLAVKGASDGQYLELKKKEGIPGVVEYGRVPHPGFPLFIKAPSNYVVSKGRIITFFLWSENQDAYVDQLEKGLEGAPIAHPIIHESYKFDWENRIISRVSNMALLPKGEWYRNNSDWAIDTPMRFESLGGGMSIVCMMSQDLYGWEDKVYVLQAGEEVTLDRDLNSPATYIMSIDEDVVVKLPSGDLNLSALDTKKMSSDSLTISASVETMLLWRTKL